jgi:hypothetical protein
MDSIVIKMVLVATNKLFGFLLSLGNFSFVLFLKITTNSGNKELQLTLTIYSTS